MDKYPYFINNLINVKSVYSCLVLYDLVLGVVARSAGQLGAGYPAQDKFKERKACFGLAMCGLNMEGLLRIS